MSTDLLTTTNCPPSNELERLLRGRLTEARSATISDHVGTCSHCQKRLELLAGGGEDLATKLRECEQDQPPRDSAYWKALSDAEHEVAATALALSGEHEIDLKLSGERSLDFLKPSREAGRLGTVGAFDIIREVGRGGMGVVLHAYDMSLQRDVAIKVIDPQLANNEIARQRFCREARAAAAVTHDNLVAVHQVDEDEYSGLPYLVMQLINGESLEQRLKRVGKLPVNEVARIGMQAAAGLAAAHAGGLIHRDIKPGNILLEAPADRVKLTDFGLARAAEDVKLTRTGFVAGSPLYMSPEQARGEEVDARADLFSLGSVLYEAITGAPPFEGKTPLVVLRRVADETPRPLREIDPEVPDWMSDIVGKLLAKSPEDRYANASEVAEVFAVELARVHALSPLDVPAEIVCSSSTRSGTSRVRKHVCWKSVALRVLPWIGGALLGCIAMALLQQPTVVERTVQPPQVPIAMGPQPRWSYAGDAGSLWALAFIPKSDDVVLGYENGTLRIYNYKRQQIVKPFDRMNGTVWSADVSPDAARLAVACDDSVVSVFNLKNHYEKEFSPPLPTSTKAAAFSADGQKLATGDRSSTIRLWDLRSDIPIELNGHRGTIHSLAFDPSGIYLASAGSDGRIKIWDTHDEKEKPHELVDHKGAVYSVTYSPNGQYLASAGWDGMVRIWNVDRGELYRSFHPQDGDAWSVSFGNNGKWVAATVESSVRVWDIESEKEIFHYQGNRAFHVVRFAPDGTTLAAGGRDGVLRIWELAPNPANE